MQASYNYVYRAKFGMNMDGKYRDLKTCKRTRYTTSLTTEDI